MPKVQALTRMPLGHQSQSGLAVLSYSVEPLRKMGSHTTGQGMLVHPPLCALIRLTLSLAVIPEFS